jgi:hypothetical protein
MEGVSMTSNKNSFIELFKRERYLFLLVSLVLLLLITPLFEGFFELTTLLDFSITIIFLASLYAIGKRQNDLRIAVLLLLPVITAMWVTYFVHVPYLSLVGDCCSILFLAFTIIIILSTLFKEKEVTLDVIYSAFVSFMLIALMWAFIFDILEGLSPGSFLVTQGQFEDSRIHFIYYSFVTITTVGFGDILPVSLTARAFSIVEMVVGQIFLIVLIARLVGINITQSMDKKS